MSIIIDIPNLKKPDRCLECPLLHHIEEDYDHFDFYICPLDYYKQSVTKTPMSLDDIHDGVLESCPIQDVQKGAWIFDQLAGDWVCSECDLHSMEHGKYCPNCGVKMDGGKNDG